MRAVTSIFMLLSLIASERASGMLTTFASIAGGVVAYRCYSLSEENGKDWRDYENQRNYRMKYNSFMLGSSSCAVSGWVDVGYTNFVLKPSYTLMGIVGEVQLPSARGFMLTEIRREYWTWARKNWGSIKHVRRRDLVRETKKPYNELSSKIHGYNYVLSAEQLQSMRRFLHEKSNPACILNCSDECLKGLPIIFRKAIQLIYSELYKGACYSPWQEVWRHANNAAVFGFGALTTAAFMVIMQTA